MINKGLSCGKLLFALLIPFLHIPFSDIFGIEIIRQYVARLGVPFFFAASGYLLSISIRSRGQTPALKRYVVRIGTLLVTWLLVYFPIFIRSKEFIEMPVKLILFKTPGFLWYLTAMLFAAIPFCLAKNRKVLYIVAGTLYIIGTLMGGSYSWLVDDCPFYSNIFLTTRNGLFFALPLMCTGEIVWSTINKESFVWTTAYRVGIVCEYIVFCAEVSFCRSRVLSGVDCSMYFTLPLMTFLLLLFFLTHFNSGSDALEYKSRFINKWSSAIYLLQYGVIQVGGALLHRVGISTDLVGMIIYILIVVIALLFAVLLNKAKWSKYIL